MKYKMIVFDCDGTLVDASHMITLLYEGYQKAYPKRKRLPYEYFVPCYFMSTQETTEYLKIEKQNEEEFNDICFGKEENHLDNIKVFPHIKEVILKLKAQDIVLGIATSRNEKLWNMARNQIGDEAFLAFRYIATNDKVENNKPASDSLCYLSKESGISMRDILFVGDSINDALCAKNARCDFAFAKWGMISKTDIPKKYELNNPLDLLELI
ncbi:MAG: HAD family hydrolase [Longicatena sp.]